MSRPDHGEMALCQWLLRETGTFAAVPMFGSQVGRVFVRLNLAVFRLACLSAAVPILVMSLCLSTRTRRRRRRRRRHHHQAHARNAQRRLAPRG